MVPKKIQHFFIPRAMPGTAARFYKILLAHLHIVCFIDILHLDLVI